MLILAITGTLLAMIFRIATGAPPAEPGEPPASQVLGVEAVVAP